MLRRKNTKLETTDEVTEEMASAGSYFNEEVNNIFTPELIRPELVEPKDDSSEYEKKRDELLKLAEDGDLDKSVAYIKKASHKVINKLYTEYERKRILKANVFLIDLLISKFSNALGGFDAIESPDVLENELKKGEFLKKNVQSLIKKITPYFPFIGILPGGITTVKHVYDHKSKTQNPDITSDTNTV